MKKNGDVNEVLIFDKYLAHNIDMPKLFPRLTIKFLPTDVTKKHQPANTGMTAMLNVGYKSLFLRTLMGNFDPPV